MMESKSNSESSDDEVSNMEDLLANAASDFDWIDVEYPIQSAIDDEGYWTVARPYGSTCKNVPLTDLV